MATAKKTKPATTKPGKAAADTKKATPAIKTTRVIEEAVKTIYHPPIKITREERKLDATYTAGEFRGDFTRDTFDPAKHFSRVLMQQGRVQLDADWNEQTAILLHYLQTLAADLIGPSGGPSANCGFEIKPDTTIKNDFVIGTGRYYINGILCENENDVDYSGQLSSPGKLPQEEKKYLVYLDAWERNISCIEDMNIREVALNGPDTATRAKVEWMVRTGFSDMPINFNCDNFKKIFSEISRSFQLHGNLKAIGKTEDKSDDICSIHPDAQYRGLENQLYRVEIHNGGIISGTNNKGIPSFKWSRENGAVQFPILALEGKTVTFAHLGRDESQGLKPGNLVEIIDDDYVKQFNYYADPTNPDLSNNRKLYKIDIVDTIQLTVTLTEPHGISNTENLKHPLLRRWDHTAPVGSKDNCIPIVEWNGNDDTTTFELEEGIKIQFHLPQGSSGYIYVPGNYWLIPARVLTGDIDWPCDNSDYQILPPHGVIHHYAPLGIISVGGMGDITLKEDCRCQFNPICKVEDQIPDQLNVTCTANPKEVAIGSGSELVIYVKGKNNEAISGAKVVLINNCGGTFGSSPTDTNSNGFTSAVWKAPSTTFNSCEIKAVASKTGSGYTPGTCSITIKETVKDPLNVSLTAIPSDLNPKERSEITIKVTDTKNTSIKGAEVRLSSDCGTVMPTSRVTNNDGITVAAWTAPPSQFLSCKILAVATKTPYKDGNGEVTISCRK